MDLEFRNEYISAKTSNCDKRMADTVVCYTAIYTLSKVVQLQHDQNITYFKATVFESN